MVSEADLRLTKFLARRSRPDHCGDQYQETDPVKLQDQINTLSGELSMLSDILTTVVRERDRLRQAHESTKETLRFLNIKFWVMSGVVGVQTGAIAWLVTALFSRLR